ncbi:hypothetical protein KKF34_14870 [Myxococcota bacterium]|nr:hypothetical protein [Myxococcota bacterium]MBU1381429.1 hypothetical protein [Myxococcota bacterium]MBU1498158.1 hypothetical protein [Myxococcota bacterium]
MSIKQFVIIKNQSIYIITSLIIILFISFSSSCRDPGIQFTRRIESDKGMDHTGLVFENDGKIVVTVKIFRPGKVYYEYTITPGMTFRITVAPGDARIEIKPGKRVFTIRFKAGHRYYFNLGDV